MDNFITNDNFVANCSLYLGSGGKAVGLEAAVGSGFQQLCGPGAFSASGNFAEQQRPETFSVMVAFESLELR